TSRDAVLSGRSRTGASGSATTGASSVGSTSVGGGTGGAVGSVGAGFVGGGAVRERRETTRPTPATIRTATATATMMMRVVMGPSNQSGHHPTDSPQMATGPVIGLVCRTLVRALESLALPPPPIHVAAGCRIYARARANPN